MRLSQAGCVVFAALVVLGACSSGTDDSSDALAEAASGAVIPAPPVPLDQHPTQFAAGDHYFVVHTENSLAWRSMAAYSFKERRWRKLPTPPDFRDQSRAWDGKNLVLVGLRDCKPAGIRCTSGVPTAAFIEPTKGQWRIVDLGFGRIEVSSEVGWGMEVFGGSNGHTYLTDEENRVVRLGRSGELDRGPQIPVGTRRAPCLVGDSLVVVASAPAGGITDTPLTPADARILTLPLDFDPNDEWSPREVALPRFAQPEAEARPACGGDGVVLLDVINERALTWGPGAAAWSFHDDLGDGPLSHQTADMMDDTTNGDLVGVEHQRDAQFVFRLHFGGPTGAAHWTRQQAEWVGFDVVDNRVLIYPDQRPTEDDRRTWRLAEASL